MVGPRSMGAGTPKPAPGAIPGTTGSQSTSAPNKSTRYNFNHETKSTTNGHGALHQHGSIILTPAQQLIERYERMNTPPQPPPRHHPRPRQTHNQNHQTRERYASPPLKSTYRTQYVYDFTKPEQENYTAANAIANFNAGLKPQSGALATPERHKDGIIRGKKDKSPIRQSLKNLFSVLRKGASGGLAAAKRRADEAQGYTNTSLGAAAARHRSSSYLKDTSADVTLAAATTKKEVDQPNVLTSSLHTDVQPPKKKMSGSLLYLTRGTQALSSETPGPLTWATCSVTLDSEKHKLIVTSFMGELELYVHEIPLAKCSDIHSLSTSQLTEEESNLLTEAVAAGGSRVDSLSLKVFEILFDDGNTLPRKEKFAARSVKERAGWISAIWDSILPYQYHDVGKQLPVEELQHEAAPASGDTFEALMKEKHALEAAKLNGTGRTSNLQQPKPETLAVLVESPLPLPIHKLSPLLEEDFLERSLPPLPEKSPALPQVLPLNVPDKPTVRKHPDLHLDLSELQGPISPSIYPPTSIGPSPGAADSKLAAAAAASSPDNKLPQLARLDTTSTTLSNGSKHTRVVIAPFSPFVASPEGCSTPGSARSHASSSPSIANLSQLSVVRQRLAQIERTHSQLSAESEVQQQSQRTRSRMSEVSSSSVVSPAAKSYTRSSRASTPTSPSPVSPAGSGWSKGEAIFLNTTRKGTSLSVDKGVSSGDSGKTAAASSSGKETNSGRPPTVDAMLSTRVETRDKATPQESSRSKDKDKKNQKAQNMPDSFSKDLPGLPPPSPIDSEPASISVSGNNPTASTSSNSTFPREEMHQLSKGLSNIKDVLGGESGYPTIHQMIVGLEQRVSGDEKHFLRIQETLKVLQKQITDAMVVAEDVKSKSADVPTSSSPDESPTSPTKGLDNDLVLQALKDVQERLSQELPVMTSKLQEIKDAQEKNRQAAGSSKEGTSNAESVPPVNGENGVKEMDLDLLLMKLEEIKALCTAFPSHSEGAKGGDNKDDNGVSENIAKILTLVQEDGNKQTLLSQQQADSVRYLNELNSWLEAFVNNGTSQIQGISSNIERLCHELGCKTKPVHEGADHPNLMNDIRQLVAGMKARDQNFTALQAAVHSLLEVLTVSQTQQGADSQALAGMMDRQRHDQQTMFRAFTNEISGEIKGERLRFVEAMKEATAINVQMHVEQFKQQLSREVMTMTEEVRRLHREKLQVENQISDLFSFYSKHSKQGDMPLQVISQNAGAPIRPMQDNFRADIPRSNQHRLLPYPMKPQS
ncbi:hypothetical protein D9613_000491 [Agrocybe pediades]|uniref:PH domain-containing protein n=1 Tax=Agrocybe pediades TaxID=84607 RepID=A0A8H4VSR0_9AGAR|nr:hypothetical protein D9613_000491 [Agrocybe pediades]